MQKRAELDRFYPIFMDDRHLALENDFRGKFSVAFHPCRYSDLGSTQEEGA